MRGDQHQPSISATPIGSGVWIRLGDLIGDAKKPLWESQHRFGVKHFLRHQGTILMLCLLFAR